MIKTKEVLAYVGIIVWFLAMSFMTDKTAIPALVSSIAALYVGKTVLGDRE